MSIDVNDVNNRDFISDIFDQIDSMNGSELEKYLKFVDESINNCVEMSEEIALMSLKNRAQNRLILFKREALKV